MLTASEQKLASTIFWVLFILSAVCTIGGYIAVGASVIYAVQAAIMYTRIAREDWKYTAGLRAQFQNTQKFYWIYLCRVFAPAAADEDQQYLDTYGGGRTIQEWIGEWCKRLLRGMAILVVWIPAMVLHGCILSAAALGNQYE